MAHKTSGAVPPQISEGQSSGPATILIVDDHPLVREGLSARISAQPDMAVCGEASGIDEALALVDTTQPTLMIVDLALQDGHGLDLIKKVRQHGNSIKILVLSAHEGSVYAERTLQAGAQGYIDKQQAQTSIIEAIRTVLRGNRYLTPKLTERFVDNALSGQSKSHGVESLSDRELEVFRLIGLGRSTRNIAAQLHLSIHTIETHRENIRAKLNLQSGTELMQRAVQWVLETR